MRAHAVPPALALSTNTVSGWLNSRATRCIEASSMPSASNTTASGLPAKRRVVKTSSVTKGYFMKPRRLRGPLHNESIAFAFRDQLVVLVERLVVELDDAGAG